MKFTTPFNFVALLVLFIGAFLLEGCTNPDLEGDPRKLSIYRVDIKRTDIDFPIEEIDCSNIPTHPCYCLTDTTGGISYLKFYVKNCGDDGTADSIAITTKVYSRGSATTLSAESSNPTSLAQDALGTFEFSTSSSLTSVDSVTFDLSWVWAGSGLSDTSHQSSLAPCTTNCR